MNDMDIHFDSDRKFIINGYEGITFNNYKLNEFSINYLLGEHKDYIAARKMIREKRQNWTNEDYLKLLKG
jgi:hypothetical protein